MQVTATEVIEGGVDWLVTVTVAVADLVASSVLVAVTVTDPADPGAVKRPLVLTVPPFVDHFTAELKLPVPCTVAVHCDVALGATVEGLQVSAIEEMVEDPERRGLPAVPLPQAVSPSRNKEIASTGRSRSFEQFLLALRCNLVNIFPRGEVPVAAFKQQLFPSQGIPIGCQKFQ